MPIAFCLYFVEGLQVQVADEEDERVTTAALRLDKSLHNNLLQQILNSA
jgi:hypothetical protein